MGDDEIALTRETLSWKHAPFDLDDAIYDAWNGKAKGDVLQKNWQANFDAYQKSSPTACQ